MAAPNDEATSSATVGMLLDLPPMERHELERIVEGAAKILDDESTTTLDALWKTHAVRTCSGTEVTATASSSPSSVPEYLYAKMIEYQDRYRAKGVTARCTVTDAPLSDENSNAGAVVRSYAEHLDAANCNAGSWSAVWNIEFRTEKEANLSGTIQFRVHHSESGSNVQTNATREFTTQLVTTEEEMVNSMVAKFEKSTMSFAEQMATKIAAQIAAYESDFHESLHTVYDNEVEEGLRKLRRILPITKTRFKWDSAAQKNVKLLNARTTK